MRMIGFDAAFPRLREESAGRRTAGGVQNPEVRQLISEYGATCYEEGLYRIFDADDAERWTITIRRFFPAESEGVEAFGRDWQGNLFGYRGGESPCVLLFQPGTGDVLEITDSIEKFHNEELTEHAEEALSLGLWQQWRSHSRAPGRGECVGYTHPIFLGGDVALDNLTIGDIDVYWELTGQLLKQVRHLPDGTRVKAVKLVDPTV